MVRNQSQRKPGAVWMTADWREEKRGLRWFLCKLRLIISERMRSATTYDYEVRIST
jgi:hypothetical protein